MNVFKSDYAEGVDEDIGFGNKNGNIMNVTFELLDSSSHSQEVLTFDDHSKDFSVTAIDWQPGSKGTVAVALRDNTVYEDQLLTLCRDRVFQILVWNLVETLGPQVDLLSYFSQFF